ncbi:alkaline phosphatase family protein [Sinorhizobium meliloti]|uniref:alkaline phosphatase family protein n=1 Tax=Rhizobium meliloti TaxID=382 RepID=UPI000FDBFA05|nr:alkaline phosphatase family protein [Sinorhizobium meliloti]RVM17891.1 alkaline phosphatase family protein [Sinorhizobium meliloti]RVO34199.1 alkaline phosphatase family protein [Sinorhizobium meliloti]
MKKKLIAILVDGLSANYVREHRHLLPNLYGLGESGTMVDRLGAAVPGTSMPGRSCMLTGSTAASHGVYGNHILYNGAFKPAYPEDVGLPTIATLANRAGLDVACVGAGMVRPEDTHLFIPPAWLRGFLRGSRFHKHVPADRLERTRVITDIQERLKPFGIQSPYGHEAETLTVRDTPPVVAGFIADQLMIRTAAALANSDSPPDLILTEISMTDSTQHNFGYGSEVAHWAIGVADALIGSLINQLQQSGRIDDYAIAIASDHGHTEIRTAIFPEAIIPGITCECEGATLHVAVRNSQERANVTDALRDFGVEEWTSDHIPEGQRELIATYVAPRFHSFEEPPDSNILRETTGRPQYISTHGVRPGEPEDDRFCVFAGAGVPKVKIDKAKPEQYAASLARLLGLPNEINAVEALV